MAISAQGKKRVRHVVTLFAIGAALMANAGAQGTQSLPQLPSPVPDPGVVTTGQKLAGHSNRRVYSGRVMDVRFGSTDTQIDALASPQLSAVSAGVRIVPLREEDAVSLIDVRSGKLLAKIRTGVAPYAAAMNSAGTIAYVTNWGGRFPRAGDRIETTGVIAERSKNNPAAGDPVVVDARGIASTGTVSLIDVRSRRVVQNIVVGRQPTALLWDQRTARLYVADSNDDAISVIDTNRNAVVRTVSLAALSLRHFGIAPLALALSHDGTRLFVACAGINAVAVIDTKSAKVAGAMPTDWYPDSLAISPSGRYLAVGTLLGVGSGWNNPKLVTEVINESGPSTIRPGPHVRYVHIYRGTVDLINIAGRRNLAADTLQVQKNDRFRNPVSHWSLPIRHVVYIIKENRSYDQVLGDIGKGNSDPSLVMFGKNVTPNHHRLAGQFVLLDNFYATGGDSGDGHQWITQSNETPYAMLPGYDGRSYPFDGTDPIAYSAAGFLWTMFARAGLSVADFGEFAGIQAGDLVGPGRERSVADVRMQYFHEWLAGATFLHNFHSVAPLTSLNAYLVRDYPEYGGIVPDVVRARIFLRHLKTWTKEKKMPNLTLVQLPSDHTAGTSPGYATPRAALADNDYALGQIVQGLSHSPFWKSMVIFAVEDDAQGGVDHVDGHRTVALVVSPYIRRDSIDSTFYAHQSIAKTIEAFFGLPAMTLFDSTANDMRRSFTTHPDLRPYTAVKPSISLLQTNPEPTALRGPARAAAIASSKMNFTIPDAAPSDAVNHILWHTMRGWNTPYPLNGGRPSR